MSDDPKDIAKDIRERIAVLNRLVKQAAALGIQIDFHSLEITTIGDNVRVVQLEPKIFRVL